MNVVYAKSHVCPKNGDKYVEARVTYPVADIPERVVIYGTGFRREHAYRRKSVTPRLKAGA